MRTHAIVIALAAGLVSGAALAQTGSAQPNPPGRGQPDAQAKSKADYAADDCRKDMANAEHAKQAGHITDREHAEQKKMAQTKMKRDSGQAAGAGGKGPC